MLTGRTLPELGGGPDMLDIVGVNYYWTNQWILNGPDTPLAEDDPRHCRLRDLIRLVAEGAEALLGSGAPLRGICLYPILGMPEWHNRCVWTSMGLWDLVRTNGHLERVCHTPMLDSLRQAQERLKKYTNNGDPKSLWPA